MIDKRFKAYGFHRYRRERHLTSEDIITDVHDNNTICNDYHGFKIFIQWHRNFDFNTCQNNSYIEAYILRDGKYVARYVSIYEEKMELYRRCTKYVDYLIKNLM